MRARILVTAVAAALLLAFPGGGGSAAQQRGDGGVRLPRGAAPDRIALSPDGTLWVISEFGSLSRGWRGSTFDRDGEPEVLLRLDWNGTHCCTWTRFYRWDAGRRTYVARSHFWGHGGAEPTLRDLDGDRRPELVSVDDRFAELGSFAQIVRPVQIWAYRGGRLVDVTRRHPRAVRADAARLWRLYRAGRGRRSVRFRLAAWVATQHLVGRGAAADREVARAVRRGHLAAFRFGDTTEPTAFIAMLQRFLRKTGYIRR